MATQDQRDHMKAIMKWMIDHHASIRYNQFRPMMNIGIFEQELVGKVSGGGTVSMDCSEFVTLLAKWSGLKDPNGMGYSGYGNSSTMYDARPHYTNPAQAHVGAIVVFGAGGAQHAAVVMTPGSDPMLCSHGSSNGPIAVTLSGMAQSMGNPVVTFLDVGTL